MEVLTPLFNLQCFIRDPSLINPFFSIPQKILLSDWNAQCVSIFSTSLPFSFAHSLSFNLFTLKDHPEACMA